MRQQVVARERRTALFRGWWRGVTLSAQQAERIGLAAHEPTSKACRGGSGSLPSEINKTVNMDHGGPRRLVLNWIEQGWNPHRMFHRIRGLGAN